MSSSDSLTASAKDVVRTGGETCTRRATIVNRRGLHARAAAKFVKLAGQFDAEIVVAKRGTEVCGLSIMGLMMLAAGPGCTIEMRAHGKDAVVALAALAELIDAKFGEE